MAVIYRTTGPWGVGKGSNLTPAEFDGNFWDLLQRITDLESEGILPRQIHAIEILNNRMTVIMDDLTTTFGPFTLPVAAFKWTAAYQAGRQYELYDVFTARDGMYLVMVPHEAASEFDPNEGNSEGDYYVKIFDRPTVYDIGFFAPGTPGYGIEVGRPMLSFLAVRDFWLPVDLPLSRGVFLNAPTESELVFEIHKNQDVIGVFIGTGGQTEGSFDFADNVQFSAGDVLHIIRPDVLDSTATDLAMTIVAQRGTF